MYEGLKLEILQWGFCVNKGVVVYYHLELRLWGLGFK